MKTGVFKMKYTYLLCPIIAMGLSSCVFTTPRAEEGTSFTDESAILGFERLPAPPSEGLHGAAWLDFDNDRDLDLFIPAQPGSPNILYRNDNGTFLDVAVSAGVTGGTGHAGAVAADINNDGCTDLLATGTGGIGSPATNGTPHNLYKNNCNGTFTDITATAGITAPHPAMMAAFGDIDNDGDVDLFITSPGSFATGLTPQTLYMNNGDDTFSDISVSAGIASSLGGCVVNFVDLDRDGYQDILLGNCNNLAFPSGVGAAPGIPIPGPWELWHNNGNNTFTDVANTAGLNVRPGFPMALTIADIENDGDLDIFATGLGVFFGKPNPTPSEFGLLAEQVLFVNNGDGTFSDGTYSHGLGGYEWGWGASFADFDADGDEDIFQVGSMPPVFGVLGSGLASPGHLFQNDGSGNMSNVDMFGLQDDFVSGLATTDYDGNGFVDVIILKTAHTFSNLFGQAFTGNGKPLFLSNNGNSNHSITVALKGTASNANGIGARVEAKTGNITRTKIVFAGTSFASDNGPWLTFGLGQHKFVKLQVTWPSGLIEKFNHVDANQLITLEEGTGIPVKRNKNK